jgi:hypothetical protein
MQVEIAIRARVAYAVDRRRKGDPRAQHLIGELTRDPFSPKAYDAVMAHESARRSKLDPVAAWRAREYVADDPCAHLRRPLHTPDPEPAANGLTEAEIGAMADAFLAAIRPLNAEAP